MDALNPLELGCAALSSAIYIAGRDAANRTPIPPGATQVALPGLPDGHVFDPATGFEAGLYQYQGRYIIAYAGTDPSDRHDLAADAMLGAGVMEKQMQQAAVFYEKVKAQVGENGDNIVFTGHSLGGGLAALMGVFFNKQAITFDPAPFRLAATLENAQGLQNYLTTATPTRPAYAPDPDLASYTTTEQSILTAMPDLAATLIAVAAGSTVIPSVGPTISAGLATTLLTTQYPTTIRGESNIKAISVSGEFLTNGIGIFTKDEENALRIMATVQPDLIDINPSGVQLGPFDLHSIALLNAAAIAPSLVDTFKKDPEFVEELFDQRLYAAPPKGPVTDFLNKLLKEEYGNGASATGSGYIEKFADDLLKLVGDAGVAQTQVQNALALVAMEYYYNKDASSATSIFSIANGGLHFKYSDIGAATYKSLPRLASAIEGMLPSSDRPYLYNLISQNAWHIQQGTDAMVWVASPNDMENNVAVGGVGNDYLAAGAGRDILIGGAGDDVLVAGTGGDTLLGGLGADTYVFKSGDGTDTVVDADGQGQIIIDGVKLTGGKAVAADNKLWESNDSNSVTFALIPTGNAKQDLLIEYGNHDSVRVTNYTPGSLGITLQDYSFSGTPTTPPPDTLTTVQGQPVSSTVNGQPFNYTSYQGDDAGDLVVTGNGANAIHVGNGNNSITGGTGNDTIYSGSGDSTINGGGGSDFIFADGAGNNVISGDGGQDIIYGSAGTNRIYADSAVDVPTAITQSKILAATGNKGDVILVGGTDDTVIGGEGNDFIYVCSKKAVIVAGPGNDTIVGGVSGGGVGQNWTPSSPQWSGAPLTSRMIITPPGLEVSTDGVLTNGTGSETYSGRYDTNTYEGVTDAYGKPVGIGDATIFAGSGNDIIGLSNGNNYVDAGTGNSTIFGGMGDNTIFGGTGDVVVIAGGGNDYIDAESGNDYLVGGGGNNTIVGGSGHSTIYAGANGDHWASARTGNNYVEGGSGDAQIYGSGGNDTLIAGDGNSSIWGGAGHEVIVGGSGNDLLVGGSGTNTITAGAGNNTIYAGDGTSTVYGGDGVDVIYGGAGTDVIYAGDGGAAGSPTKIFAGSGDTTIYGGLGVEEIHGGSGDDVIYLSDGGTGDARTVVYAGSGNTTIYGGLGVAEIHGGTGNDVLYAGDGGSSDAPTYVYAGTGHDTLYGGAGVSVLDATASTGAVIEAGDGDATLLGGAGDDTLIAGSGTDVLDGGAGNNTYVFNSDSGQSEIVQSSGLDALQFGAGITTGDLGVTATLGANGSAALEIDGANGSLVVDGGLTGRVGTVSFADSGSISLTQLMRQASAESTVVEAASGNLVFSVEDGQQLIGGGGQDTISAWGDNDTLVAGAGVSTLFGAGSNDTFVVSHSADVVIAQPGQGATIESSVSYTLADNVKTLVLTGSDDVVGTANSLNDVTVVANSGNDTLVGGTGSGKLVGGAGSDTFMLNSGMGAYTAVNNSALGAVAQLGAGIDLDSIVATRQGNDLQLQIEGSPSSLLLQNYYINPQVWTIKDASGGTITQQDLFNVSLLEKQFTDQLQAQDARYYQIFGYVQQADGSWYLAPQVSGSFAEYHKTWTDFSAYKKGADQNGSGATIGGVTASNGWESLTTTNGESWSADPYAGGFHVYDITDTVQHTVVTATDDVVYIDDSGTSTQSPAFQAWLPVQWTSGAPYGGINQYEAPAYVYPDGTFGTQYRTGALPATKFLSETWNTQYVSAHYASGGNLGLLLTDPGSQQTSGPTPAVLKADYTHEYSSYTYQQVNLAPGNHEVYDDDYSSSTTVINAGVGDNTISGGGFVNAGSGDNIISDANIVYAGSGNNAISSATTVYGGSGNDTIDQVQYYYGGSGSALVTDAYDYAYAGTGNDTIFAQDSATVYGGSGDDLIVGNAATIVAGTGDDTLLGGQWGADFVIDPRTVKHDLIGGVSDQSNNLLADYYQAQGIANWYNGYVSPDTYSFWWPGNTPHSATDAAAFAQQYYGVTLQQAVDKGWVYYNAPLPTLAVVPSSSVQPAAYYASTTVPIITFSADHPEAYSPYLGVIDRVDFGAGVALSNLHFSWGHVTTALSGYSSDPQQVYATLNIDWGTDQSVRVILPNPTDPIGSGIQEFDFADGTKVGMADMLALAASQPDQLVNLSQGDGFVTVSPAGMTSLRFGNGIASSDIAISRSGRDLVLTDRNGTDQWTLTGWYADPSHVPQLPLTFSDGTAWSAGYLTEQGLVMDGHSGNQSLQGLSDFANVFVGGPGDTLTGGNLNDTVSSGDGANQVTLGNGNNQVTLGAGNNGISAGNGNNAMHVGDGNNQIALGGGSDTIVAGSGNNTITVGGGADSIVVGNGSNQIQVGDGTDSIQTGTGTNTISLGTGQYALANDGGHDTVYLPASIASNQLSFNQDGNDLLVTVSGTTTHLRLTNWFNGAQPDTKLVTSDGTHSVASLYNGQAIETKTTQTDAQGITTKTDTFTQADGSYQQSWTKSDGSSGTNNYVAATGETSGTNATAGAAYSYSWDNTKLANGAAESKVTYDYADGSTYSTDTLTQADGSYQQSWTKLDGSTGTNNYVAATGETSGTNATTGAAYSYGWDNTKLANGAAESKATYDYTDGSTYSTDTVTQADGSYQQSWTKSGGSSGTNNYVAATGETSGTNATAGAAYSYRWDNTKLANGAAESKVTYDYTDGSTYSTDTVTQTDGSYQQSWTKSDGSSGTNNYVAATGETSGSNATVGAAYSYSWDNTKLANGASESKVTYDYTDGSTYATDTVTQTDGSYQQTWTKSDGSTGTNNYVAATGETSGTNATAGAAYSYSWDSTKQANGATESKVTYDYTDRSTYSTDTVTQADGSYQQAWTKSDGTSGSNAVLDNNPGSLSFTGGSNMAQLGGGVASIATTGGTNQIALGTGQATVDDQGGSNTINLGNAIDPSQLWFSQSGGDLMISVLGSNESLDMANWFNGAANDATITAGGQSLSNASVAQLVQAMAAFSAPAAGQTSYTPDERQALAPLVASSWH